MGECKAKIHMKNSDLKKLIPKKNYDEIVNNDFMGCELTPAAGEILMTSMKQIKHHPEHRNDFIRESILFHEPSNYITVSKNSIKLYSCEGSSIIQFDKFLEK